MTDSRRSAGYRNSLELQRRHLEQHAVAADIELTCVQPIIDHLLPFHAEAESGAIQNARRFTWSAVTIHALPACAVLVSIGQLLHLPSVHGVSRRVSGPASSRLTGMRSSMRMGITATP